MEKQEEKQALTDYLEVDPKTGEILTPLQWDTVSRRYVPARKEDLSPSELYLLEGSARLRKWAFENANKKKER